MFFFEDALDLVSLPSNEAGVVFLNVVPSLANDGLGGGDSGGCSNALLAAENRDGGC